MPSGSIRVNRTAAIRFAALLSALLLIACARPAPPVPAADAASVSRFPALSDDQRLMRCATLAAEIATRRAEMREIEQVIEGRRTRDQVTAYLAAVLYPPLLGSMDRHKAQRRALDERQRDIDSRLVERQARHCPASGR